MDDSIWFSVNWEGNQAAAWLTTLFIVMLKTVWMALWGSIVHGVIGLLHTQFSELVYPLSAMCFFTLGLLGLFPPQEIAVRVTSVSSFWFYACFVWGFYFIAMERQLKGA
ncbi:hypothetical protein [Pseudomonas chlororaphis]|nr:hypothetical protein [Pseudomonas chlororaphis]